MSFVSSLSEPNKGLHVHFCGIAIFDLLLTIIGAGILHLVFSISFIVTFLLLFVLGEVLHFIFNVETVVTKQIKRLVCHT